MGDEHPDWLPLGWRVSVKARSSGKKDKYYINPSNGLKFNSKPGVLRYIKSSGKDRKSEELNKIIDIEKSVAKKLPPGWIKKIRTKKTGCRTRRDPYYIDPVSGRHFRSIPEVFRYLKSEDAIKAESKSDEILTGHEGIKSTGIKSASGAANIVIMQEDDHLEQREKHDSLANELSGKLKLMEQDSNVAAEPKKLDTAPVEQRDDDSTCEGPQHENVEAHHYNRRNPNLKRTSKRLAGVEVDSNDHSGNIPTDKKQKKPIEHDVIESKEDEKHLEESPLKDLLMDPCIEFAIKTLTGAIPIEDVINRVCDSPVSSLPSPNQTSASSSSVDIWADPCFEFAVKTLTGDIIPMTNPTK